MATASGKLLTVLLCAFGSMACAPGEIERTVYHDAMPQHCVPATLIVLDCRPPVRGQQTCHEEAAAGMKCLPDTAVTVTCVRR